MVGNLIFETVCCIKQNTLNILGCKILLVGKTVNQTSGTEYNDKMTM